MAIVSIKTQLKQAVLPSGIKNAVYEHTAAGKTKHQLIFAIHEAPATADPVRTSGTA